jgi:hypothetical protein
MLIQETNQTSRWGMVRTAPPRPGWTQALLYDFNIAKSDLKRSHYEWLQMEVISAIRRAPGSSWHVYLKGMTSRTGSDDFNRGLSDRRAKAVESHLVQALGASARGVNFVTWGVGKTMATGPRPEDAGDRAVEVAVCELPGVPPTRIGPPEQPRTTRLPPPGMPLPAGVGPPRPMVNGQITQHFRIRQRGALNITVGLLSMDAVIFEIDDPRWKESAHYLYSGVGLGVGLPFKAIGKIKRLIEVSKIAKRVDQILQGAVGDTGPWNEFKLNTRGTTTVYDFCGYAALYGFQLGLGQSTSRMTGLGFGGMTSVAEAGGVLAALRRECRVVIEPFDGGRTFGLPSGSSTRGSLELVALHCNNH